MDCTISIFGTCVSRDIFGMHPQNGGYKIERHVQEVSPIASVAERVLDNEINLDDFEYQAVCNELKHNFHKKMLALDLNKSAFSYLGEVHSDWLMIDVGVLRLDYYKCKGKDGNNTYFTAKYDKQIENLMKNWGGCDDLKRIPCSAIPDDEYYGYMEKYALEILKLYDEEHIILHECYPVSTVTNGENVGVYDYCMVVRYRKAIEKGYEFIRNRLTNAHVIEFPYGVIGDVNHKWGYNCMHYVQEYYDYALEAVNIITNGYEICSEKEMLSELKHKYEKLLRDKYEPVQVNSMKKYIERDKLCTKMTKYEQYMKELIIKPEELEHIHDFMNINNFGSCAFYGLTELSDMFLVLFEKWEIRVDYIIEQSNNEKYKGIPLVKRTALRYPDTQLLIIADIITGTWIRRKLAKMNVPFPVHDVYEIAGMAGSKQ